PRLSFGNEIASRTTSTHDVSPSSGMRKRIAPSSSYAFPSATSWAATLRQSSRRSSWNVGGRSQSRPRHSKGSSACPTAPCTSRLVSVFSIRIRNSPPRLRAKSQLKSAVRTPPRWRAPVGLGAMRTRTLTDGAYRSCGGRARSDAARAEPRDARAAAPARAAQGRGGSRRRAPRRPPGAVAALALRRSLVACGRLPARVARAGAPRGKGREGDGDARDAPPARRARLSRLLDGAARHADLVRRDAPRARAPGRAGDSRARRGGSVDDEGRPRASRAGARP